MRSVKLLTALFLIVLVETAFASEKEDVKKANALYNSGDYSAAAKLYEKAAAQKPSSGIPDLNRGAALYKAGEYNKAIEAFNRSIASGRSELINAADYNIGNSLYRRGALKDKADIKKKDIKKTAEVYVKALQYYKRAIDLDPNDKDAKFNYEFVAKKLEDLKPLFEIKQEEEKKQEKNKDKNENKDNEDQSQQQNDQSSQSDKAKQEEEKKKEDSLSESAGGKDDEPQPQGTEEEDKAASEQSEKKEAEESQSARQGDEEKAKEAEELEKLKESESPEDKQGGLSAYQGAGKEAVPGEMTEQEAKMLLEGYKGEEATGRTVKMRQKRIDMTEPAKDW